MFGVPGVISQSVRYKLTAYDQVIINDAPLIYFPLHKNSHIQVNGLWGYKNFGKFSFNSFTYNSLPDVSAQPSIVAGSGPAMVFNSSSTITIPKTLHSGLNLHGARSVEFWIRLTDLGAKAIFADQLQPTNESQVFIALNLPEIRNDDRFFVGTISSSQGTRHWVTNPPLSLNTIYHTVVMWDFTNVWWYLNGALTRNVSPVSLTFNKSTGNLYIGRSYSDTNFLSTIWNNPVSNFAIYDKLLTSTEIVNHYNAGIA